MMEQNITVDQLNNPVFCFMDGPSVNNSRLGPTVEIITTGREESPLHIPESHDPTVYPGPEFDIVVCTSVGESNLEFLKMVDEVKISIVGVSAMTDRFNKLVDILLGRDEIEKLFIAGDPAANVPYEPYVEKFAKAGFDVEGIRYGVNGISQLSVALKKAVKDIFLKKKP